MIAEYVQGAGHNTRPLAQGVNEEAAMRKFWQAHRLSALAILIASAALSLAAQGLVTTATASSAGTPGAAAKAVRPRAVGGLDCNGLSPVQRPAEAGHDVR